MSIFGIKREEVKEKRKQRAKESLIFGKGKRDLERKIQKTEKQAEYHEAKARVAEAKRKQKGRIGDGGFGLGKKIKKLGKSGKMRFL